MRRKLWLVETPTHISKVNMILETVKIKNGADYTIINKSDFDTEKHTLFDAQFGGAAELSEKSLSKMNKAELVVVANKLGVEVTPDSETNKQIIVKILEALNEQIEV